MRIRQVEFTTEEIAEALILLMEDRGLEIDAISSKAEVVEIDDVGGFKGLTIDFDPQN